MPLHLLSHAPWIIDETKLIRAPRQNLQRLTRFLGLPLSATIRQIFRACVVDVRGQYR